MTKSQNTKNIKSKKRIQKLLMTKPHFPLKSIIKQNRETDKIFRSHRINLNIHFKTSPRVSQLRADVILKQITDSIKFHYVFRLAFQPKFVKLNEQVTVEMMKIINCWLVKIDIEHM